VKYSFDYYLVFFVHEVISESKFIDKLYNNLFILVYNDVVITGIKCGPLGKGASRVINSKCIFLSIKRKFMFDEQMDHVAET
jgi:hypothetical protein